jgi:aquaporin Z
MAVEETETASNDLADDLRPDVVIAEPAGPSLLARVGAEIIGTFILVFLGAGTALLLSVTGNGTVVVGLGFGLGAMIAIIAFGHISGAHLNPAVTVGAWIAGRLSGLDVVPYILGQVVGGIFAGLLLRLGIDSLEGVGGEQAATLMGSVSIGHGDHSPFAGSGLAWGLGVAMGVELLATALLVLVVLSATAKKAHAAIAPFAIGLALAALVTFTIPFTNAALNPARATGTALFADDWALGILWAWWLAPIVGAAIVGLAFRVFGPAEDLVAVASADVD